MRQSLYLAASALLLSACTTPPAPSTKRQGAAPTHSVGLANPASVFCIQQGGKMRMEKTSQGEHAMCILADGREVEEWAYFRQHHPQPK